MFIIYNLRLQKNWKDRKSTIKKKVLIPEKSIYEILYLRREKILN